jgi:hypothetical protein
VVVVRVPGWATAEAAQNAATAMGRRFLIKC